MEQFGKLDRNMEDRMKTLEKKFDGIFSELKNEMTGLRNEYTETKTELGKTNKKVTEIEASLTFQTDRLTESEKQDRKSVV